MSDREQRSDEREEARRVGRREFVGIGVRTAAALGTLPAAAVWSVGCGGGDESPPAGPAPSRPSEPASPKPPAPEKPAAAPSAPTPPSAPAANAPASSLPLVTDAPHLAGTVAALQYTHQSAKPDQNCGNCQLYTPEADGLGQCSLFGGSLVKESGWCMSWVEKVVS